MRQILVDIARARRAAKRDVQRTLMTGSMKLVGPDPSRSCRLMYAFDIMLLLREAREIDRYRSKVGLRWRPRWRSARQGPGARTKVIVSSESGMDIGKGSPD